MITAGAIRAQFESQLRHIRYLDNCILVNQKKEKPSGIDEPGMKPGGFELQQNYPNPFNPVTTIRYHLPVNSDVDLRVYDALGHEVAVLVGEKQSAGTREIVFDAANLSSGFYFYRLVAQSGGQAGGSFAQTKEMLLIR